MFLDNDLANFSVPYFVFTKTKIEPFLLLIWLTTSKSFSSDFNSIISWVIFSATIFESPIDTLIGSLRYFEDNFIIFFGIVAENINICFSPLICFKISFIWTSNPISSILSVSSKIKYLTSLKFTLPLRRWSFIRPGVPTKILGFLFNWDNCLLIDSPPIKEIEEIELLNPNKEWTTSRTCFANSLVGINIKTDDFFDFNSKSIIGIAYAAVFPVPVWAEPKISFPSNIIGIDFSWIGVGVIKLILLSELFKVSLRLNLENLLTIFIKK